MRILQCNMTGIYTLQVVMGIHKLHVGGVLSLQFLVGLQG